MPHLIFIILLLLSNSAISGYVTYEFDSEGNVSNQYEDYRIYESYLGGQNNLLNLDSANNMIRFSGGDWVSLSFDYLSSPSTFTVNDIVDVTAIAVLMKG